MHPICHYNWPPLSPHYDRALRQAVRYILRRYRPTAIIASGTIIRGKPHASSDLDLYVIYRRPFIQRIQKLFNGVPAEIFVNTPASVIDHFRSQREIRRPITAHMISTGFVVLNNEPMLSALVARARRILKQGPKQPTDEEIVRGRYWAGSLYEDAIDVAKSDPATGQLILFSAIHEMLQTAVMKAGRYEPRNKDLLAVVKEIDPVLGRWAAGFYTTASLKTRLALARRIADRTIQCRGFIEWESKPVKAMVLPK